MMLCKRLLAAANRRLHAPLQRTAIPSVHYVTRLFRFESLRCSIQSEFPCVLVLNAWFVGVGLVLFNTCKSGRNDPEHAKQMRIVSCEALPIRQGRPALVVDCDIGDAIDDLWALALLVNTPRVDLKLVSVCAGDQKQLESRARIVAKFLSRICRFEIPVGMGVPGDVVVGSHIGSYFPWAEDFDIKVYPGNVLSSDDTVRRFVRLAEHHEELVVLAIGSATNLAAAVRLGGEDFAKRVHVVGMYSIGENGTELGGWNASIDSESFDVLLAAPFASFTTVSTKAAYSPWRPWQDDVEQAFCSGQYVSLRTTARNPAVSALLECEHMYDQQELRSDPEGRLKRRPTSNCPSPSWDAVAAFLMLSELDDHGDAVIASNPAPHSRKSAASRLSFCDDWVDHKRVRCKFWAWCHQSFL